MGIKVIITGSTGMGGESVLFECLEPPDVTQVKTLKRWLNSQAMHAKITNKMTI